MIKKILSLLLATLLILSITASYVSAAEVENSELAADLSSESTGTSGKIYFDASKWNNVSQIYCHLWVNGGEAFYGWKSSSEKCKNLSGSLWEYDLSILDASTVVTGGLKSDEDYCLIFFADTGIQGYDTTFSTECIGDKAYLTGETIENPIDSNKLGYETVWSKTSSKYGPHFAISSIGNFLGEFTCPHESSTKIIGDWLIAYSSSQYCDPVEVLVDVMKRFEVDTANEVEIIYAYILENSGNSISDPDTMKDQLEEAYGKVNPNVEPMTIPEEPTVPEGYDFDAPSGNSGNSNSTTTASGSQTSTNQQGQAVSSSTNNTVDGSGPDGQNDVIFFVLTAIMLIAAGAFVATRKKREY